MSPIAATSASFAADVLGSDVPVLVDFWAPWCGPCRSLDPVLDQIAQEHDGRMKVVKVNTDENLELAHRFGVTSVPTMHLYVGGEPVSVIVGAKPKLALLREISPHLAA